MSGTIDIQFNEWPKWDGHAIGELEERIANAPRSLGTVNVGDGRTLRFCRLPGCRRSRLYLCYTSEKESWSRRIAEVKAEERHALAPYLDAISDALDKLMEKV